MPGVAATPTVSGVGPLGGSTLSQLPPEAATETVRVPAELVTRSDWPVGAAPPMV